MQAFSPDDARPLRVFGYGSLMWRPGFDYLDARPATAVGARRALCVWSNAYRGSPERPGLVFGLDAAEAGVETQGMLFDIAPEERQAVVDYLYERELIYPIYRPVYVDVRESGAVSQALTFAVDRRDPSYAGGLARELRVAAIATGAGWSGRARDYLANALEHLAALGAPEHELAEELAEADRLPDDPSRLFGLLDEATRRRLDLVYKPRHE